MICCAILAQAIMMTAVSTFAQEAAPPPAAGVGKAVVQQNASLAHQANAWAQARLSELDAAIAVVEEDAAKRQADLSASAEAALKRLHEAREGFRSEINVAAETSRSWTEQQIADSHKSLEKSWTAFQSDVDAYLDATKADVSTKQATLDAEFAAFQRSWRSSIDNLRADVDRVALQQRADIESRIESLRAQLDGMNDQMGRLKDTSRGSWDAIAQRYADMQRSISDTYESIRASIPHSSR
jgi:DNA repair exonuclease SbcCD ATPase subunit